MKPGLIWYCGGHGVCLTMNPTQLAQQETFLRLNTIAWLDTYLPEADGTPETPGRALFRRSSSSTRTATSGNGSNDLPKIK